MKTLRTLTWACGGIAGITLSGCFFHREHEVAYPEPPRQEVVVEQPPPPAVVEVRPYAPGPGYVWVDGYYVWTGGRYIWQRGHWTPPPPGFSVWIAPRYDRSGHGYRYVPGRWSQERREHERDRR